MAQQSLIDAFDDCVTLMANGQTVEQCLLRYPAYAAELRPLLEAGSVVRRVRLPESELQEDRALVWQQITEQMAIPVTRRRRGFPVGLLAAAVLLLALMVAMGIFLSRPQLPPAENNLTRPATETAIPSPSLSVTASVTLTPTLTATASVTLTVTASFTPTLTLTPTNTPSWTPTQPPAPSPTPSATFAPGCGAPLTQQEAINRVLAIYPNTSVTSVTQTVKFGGTLVWEIKTSHNIEVNIDVACGVILTIEQRGNPTNANTSTGNDNTNVNANTNDNVSGSSNTNDDSGSGSSTANTNSNDNSSDDDSGGGSGMGSDDG